MGRFPSGQREQTVNLPSLTSVVRIHPCPLSSAGMAELADALDSGSSEGFLHAGSSPVSRTKIRTKIRPDFFFVRSICRTFVNSVWVNRSDFVAQMDVFSPEKTHS